MKMLPNANFMFRFITCLVIRSYMVTMPEDNVSSITTLGASTYKQSETLAAQMILGSTKRIGEISKGNLVYEQVKNKSRTNLLLYKVYPKLWQHK